jgi:hypothetical protein
MLDEVTGTSVLFTGLSMTMMIEAHVCGSHRGSHSLGGGMFDRFKVKSAIAHSLPNCDLDNLYVCCHPSTTQQSVSPSY